MKTLQNDNLIEELKTNKKVLVQFGATWCGNCTMIKPKVAQLGEEHSDIEFIYVDAEKLPNSRELANVTNLPTFAYYEDGKFLAQAQGNKIELVKGLIDENSSN